MTFKRGFVPWNKGLVSSRKQSICKFCGKIFEYYPKDSNGYFCDRKCYFKSRLGKKLSKTHCENISKGRKGIIFSKEHIENMSKAFTGRKSHRKEITFEQEYGIEKSKQIKNKISENRKGIKHSEETKIKMRDSYYNSLTPELIKKRLRKREKSSLEIKFENLINQLGFPFRFVGNGEIIVARKCPDFININGEKIAVEVYYKRHKNQFRGGLDVWKAERFKIFSNAGWKLIFFDETEINKEIIKQKLGGN